MSILAYIIKPVAYVSLPAFALHTLSKSSPIARYYVRVALFLSTLGVCSIWGVVAGFGMSLVGKRLDVFWVVARSFYFLCSRAVGIRLVLEGEEYLETRPAILVGNHQSMLDILYLGRCVWYTLKLKRHPLTHLLVPSYLAQQDIPAACIHHGKKEPAVDSAARPVHDAWWRCLH